MPLSPLSSTSVVNVIGIGVACLKHSVRTFNRDFAYEEVRFDQSFVLVCCPCVIVHSRFAKSKEMLV